MDPLRTVIAEDEALTREILRAHLKRLGHTVAAEAGDGVEAVEAVRRTRPDVVLMDIRMPTMDGIEAAHRIVAETPCAIVFLTSFSQDELVEEACSAGAVGYVMKPIRKEDLGPAIEVAVRRFRELRAQGVLIVELQEKLESRKVVERAKGILMSRHHMSEEEAFRRIHFQARNQNRKMRDIAQSIITAAEFM
ncbi:MAG: response regulator [Armatimonadetes bacterium]|nr:response regulator [Armatimonadota bacterium]MDE2206969.1 response regulator [Armatimonadota bacterium]